MNPVSLGDFHLEFLLITLIYSKTNTKYDCNSTHFKSCILISWDKQEMKKGRKLLQFEISKTVQLSFVLFEKKKKKKNLGFQFIQISVGTANKILECRQKVCEA